MQQLSAVGTGVQRVLLTGAALVALSLAPPLGATGLYDTTRVLEHTDNECRDVPDCISIASAEIEVHPDDVELVSVSCPEHYPHVARWDSRQSEQIHARLTAVAGGSLTVAAVDLVDATGWITVFVGCTKERPAYPALMLSRSAVPSNHEGARRPRR